MISAKPRSGDAVNVMPNAMKTHGKASESAMLIVSALAIMTLMSIYFGSERLGLNDPVLNRIHKAQADLELIGESILLFRDKSGDCPDSLTEVLNSSISKSRLLRVPRDPWGNKYLYEIKKDSAGIKCVVWSTGADGKQGGSGDDQDIIVQK